MAMFEYIAFEDLEASRFTSVDIDKLAFARQWVRERYGEGWGFAGITRLALADETQHRCAYLFQRSTSEWHRVK
jgi:hypothetical protein